MEAKAIIARLFQARRNILETKFYQSSRVSSNNPTSPTLVRDDIRLLVIRDTEPSKKTLYDSKVDCIPPTYQKDGKRVLARCRSHKICKLRKHQDTEPKTEGEDASLKAQVKRQADTQLYGEMIFGSAPMTQASCSLKIHIIRSPPQLMVTKIFTPVPESREVSGEHESFDLYSLQSLPSDSGSGPRQIYSFDKSSVNIAQSVPVDVPSSPRESNEHDSGISASVASSSSSSCYFGLSGVSASPVGSGSLSSLTRRLKRSKHTSLEQLPRHNTDSTEQISGHMRPARYGIGIIFSLPEEDSDSFKHFEKFFFSHVTLIESHVLRLRSEVDKALHGHSRHMVSEAFEVFRDAFSDLYLTPRLPDPVWLGLMTSGTHQMTLCHQFLRDFMVFVEKWDTKSTKFFVSTLVTAVLTHHLAWVSTVTPSGPDKSIPNPSQHKAKWVVHTLGKSHPYNPLWAQLSDLYGSVGFPLQMSRTIVTGKRQDVVMKLLHIISYFIRCSFVAENTELREPFDIISDRKTSPERLVSKEVDTPRVRSASSESPLVSANSNKSTNTLQAALLFSMQTSTETLSSEKVLSNIDDLSLNMHNQSVHFTPISEDSEIISDNNQSGNDFCPECALPKLNQEEVDSFEYTVGQSVFYCEHNNSDESEFCKCHYLDSIFQGDAGHRLSSVDTVVDCDSCGGDDEDKTDCYLTHNNSRFLAQQHPHFLFRQPLPGSMLCDSDTGEDPLSLLSLSTSCSCDTANTSLVSLPHHQPTPPHPSSKSTLITLSSSNNISASEYVPSDYITQNDDIVTDKLVKVSLYNDSSAQPLSVEEKGELKPQMLSPVSLGEMQECNTVPCQVSPNEILEKVSIVRERHIGRQSELNAFNYDKSSLIHELPQEKHDSGLYSRGGSATSSPHDKSGLKVNENIEKHGDSGVFEENLHLPSSSSLPDSKEEHVTDTNSNLNQEMVNGINDDVKSIQQTTSTSVSTTVKEIDFQRTNSTFDEYYDSGLTLPSLTHLAPHPSCERSTSVESSASMVAQLSEVELPSLMELQQVQIEKLQIVPTGEPLPCMDEYFKDGEPPVLSDTSAAPQKCLEVEKTDILPSQNDIADECDPEFRSRVTSVSSFGSVFSRQNSQVSDNCKVISPTPSEYSRRRHTSGTSSIFSNNSDNAPLTDNLKEVDMPSFSDDDGECDTNLGYSLFAAYSDHYLSDFVLHGTSDTNFMGHLHQDLTYAVQNPVVDEPISEAVCILADTDKWTVRVKSCQYATSDRVKEHEVGASQLVSSIIDSVHELWKLKMAPEFCLMHLEDRLQEIFFQSLSFSKCRRSQRKMQIQDVAAMLAYDPSDLPLLVAVAGTHSQNLPLSVIE